MLNVLIVEDEAFVALGLQAVVEDAGFALAGWATNAAEALALAEKADVALVDIQLRKGDDGVVLASRLRAEHRLPVVFVTAQADPATRARAEATGCAAYLTKPYDEAELVAAIRSAAEARG